MSDCTIAKKYFPKIGLKQIEEGYPVINCNNNENDGDNTTPTHYKTQPERGRHEKLFRQIFQLILDDAMFEGIQRDRPVLEFKQPNELKETVNLTLGETPVKNHEELVKLAKQVIKYSVKVGNPHFINQLYSGVDPYGVCAEWIASSLNGSVYTYEVAPVLTMMELEVLERMRNIIGYPEGQGDGLFCPGGSIANGYAISVARYKKRPETKEKGMFCKSLVMFVSEDAHYSFKKLASFQGIGMDNVIPIKLDGVGKMIVAELEKAIQDALHRGDEPFLVAATAGTTVLGAFDPIVEIVAVCKKYGLWIHVDAAWGGGALMSSKHRTLMNGIEGADSVTWNPHKLLCAPQQCSTFLLRDGNIATDAHATKATYLFQQDKFYDTRYDSGDKHIQCGRRADVFKFWFMWKAKGQNGFEAHIDHIFAMAKFCVEEIKGRAPVFKLLLEEPECTNVCFWYIPPSLQIMDPNSAEFKEKIHKIAPKIKERMMRRGSMMVTYQPLRDYKNFFRVVIQSSEVNTEDIKYFLNEIESCGKDL